MNKRSIGSGRGALFAALAVLLPFQRAAAQRASIWRGLSHCVAASHPCTDEQVIYRLAAATDSSRREMSAAKIVGTDTIEMGALTLTRDAHSDEWVARIPTGVWRFKIGRDSLTGTLTVSDGAVMRRVSASPLRYDSSKPSAAASRSRLLPRTRAPSARRSNRPGVGPQSVGRPVSRLC